MPPQFLSPGNVLAPGNLRRVHHIALDVINMQTSRHFYGTVLGLRELTKEEVPLTLKTLVAQRKVANFVTPDGTILEELSPPNPDPEHALTRVYNLAF
jgi:glyoxylase I family protein